MGSGNNERRRYRFRAWHKSERELYPVIMIARGGVLIQDQVTERTCPREDVEVMQYSGLTDAQGQDIYEGDILEIDGAAGQVELDDGAFRLKPLGKGKSVTLTRKTVEKGQAKVIGNIYQS